MEAPVSNTEIHRLPVAPGMLSSSVSQDGVPCNIQLPKQLESVKPAQTYPKVRHRWNTNEEIASILISFDKHADWTQHEIRLRPPSGCMLLFNRNNVRYRKDGYCWKKRKDGKNIREDHMKLKVQGLECIYGSYVHSAILPTFHRRCYWLLQNTDIVLVHYLNVPYPNNTKLSIPIMSFAMEKKEWTKEELVDQLKPMFSTSDGEGQQTNSYQSSKIDETIMTLVQRLIESQDEKKHRFPSCTSNCAKGCLHSLQPDTSASQAHKCYHGNPNSNKGGNSVTVSQTQDGRSSVDLAQGPLILNLGNLTSGGGVVLMTGQTSNTMQLSIVTNTTNSGQLPSWSQGQSNVCTPTTTHNNIEQNKTAGPMYQSQHNCNCSTFSALQQPNQGHLCPGQEQSHQCEGQSYRMNKNEPGFISMATPCHGSLSSQNAGVNFERTSNDMAQQVWEENSGHGISSIMTMNSQSLPSNHCCQGNVGTYDPALNKLVVEENKGESLQQIVESATDLYPSQNSSSNRETLSSLVDDLNLELMATDAVKEAAVGSAGCKNSFEHLGDSFESLQASLNSLHGSDLNLDQLDLIDMPEFDKIYHDISNNNNIDSHNPQGSIGGRSQLNDAMGMENVVNVHAQNIEVLSRELSQSRQSLCSHNSTDHSSVVLDSNGIAINSNISSSQASNSESYGREVMPPNQSYHSGDGNLACAQSKVPGSVAMITDFSPDWTYTEGQTKVLVTGPWYSTQGTYSVLLSGRVIATTLVQDGVLRCFVPGHPVGIAPLEVACDGHVISNTVVFEFRERPKPVQDTTQSPADWFSVEDSRLHLQMMEKLDLIESALSKVPDFPHIKQTIASLSGSQIDMDICLTQHLKSLSTRLWMTNDLSAENGCMGLSLLHLSAALGYRNFIKALIKWRNENPCWLLEYEVDANSVDLNSCTPLMWACARGHKDSAVILYNWNKGPLHTPNREGNRSLILARQRGHHKLADHLELIDTINSLPLDDQFSSQSFGDMPVSSICNTQKRYVQDGNHAACSTNDTVTSVCSTPDKNCFNSEIPAATSTPVSKDGFERSDVFKSPQEFTDNAQHSSKSLTELHIDIPGPSMTHTQASKVAARDRLTRRQSDQMLQLSAQNPSSSGVKQATPSTAAERRQKLKKRLSVDILPYQSSTESAPYSMNSFQRPIREANSEPHLSGNNMEHLLCESNPMLSEGREIGSPEMLMQMDDRRIDQSTTGQESAGQVITMDTDELSDGSVSSFIDVERVSDDDYDDENLSRKGVIGGDPENPQRQMVHLAKQIIAAMPERIKSSPSRSDDTQPAEECDRERSSSYSSLQSASPRASSSYGDALSSYGEDSGIATPMRDSLAFDEYRYSDVYSDLGTPASSLSPDSTCLHSPYSPYSFHLDSPPPTTAEFMEYFNAPATFMEKDFSQLTLSDLEQRKLYEAAKVIQSAYRIYKDKLSKQSQQKREIEAAVLIQSYYRRYKQYAYYKKMTQAAVLIQSQFRSYYAQKRFKKSRDAAVVIQNQYRSYKEHERLKKGGNKSVTQRYRSHYQRKPLGAGSKGSRVVQIVPDKAEGSPPEQVNTAIEDCPQDTSSDTVTPGGEEEEDKGQIT